MRLSYLFPFNLDEGVSLIFIQILATRNSKHLCGSALKGNIPLDADFDENRAKKGYNNDERREEKNGNENKNEERSSVFLI